MAAEWWFLYSSASSVFTRQCMFWFVYLSVISVESWIPIFSAVYHLIPSLNCSGVFIASDEDSESSFQVPSVSLWHSPIICVFWSTFSLSGITRYIRLILYLPCLSFGIIFSPDNPPLPVHFTWNGSRNQNLCIRYHIVTGVSLLLDPFNGQSWEISSCKHLYTYTHVQRHLYFINHEFTLQSPISNLSPLCYFLLSLWF